VASAFGQKEFGIEAEWPTLNLFKALIGPADERQDGPNGLAKDSPHCPD